MKSTSEAIDVADYDMIMIVITVDNLHELLFMLG